MSIILFDYTVRGKSFQFQPLQRIMKWHSLINFFTLYKLSFEQKLDLLVIPKVQFPFFNATADDMPARLWN